METFVLKLAVATAPLILLVVFVNVLSGFSRWHAHHRFIWHRTRRTNNKALAAGVLLR
jgi:hypothetical protein